MQSYCKTLSLMLVPVCLALYLMYPDPAPLGLISGRPWSRFTYMWFHGNLLHYCVNIWALLSVVFLYPISLADLLLAFIIAAAVPGCCLSSTPVVGLSGVVFFLFGSIFVKVRRKRYFFFMNLAVIIWGALLTNIAWGVHLWCFLTGITYSYAKDFKGSGLCPRT